MKTKNTKEYNKEYYLKHKEKLLERRKNYEIKNKEVIQEYKKKYTEENKDKIDTYQQEYRKRYQSKRKEYSRKYYEENTLQCLETQTTYKKNNRALYNALNAKRHAAKLERTPSWLTVDHLARILVFYEEAQRLTEETGIKYSVDHILPLQGETVSGLHVPWNLQVITLSENCSKSNKIIEN